MPRPQKPVLCGWLTHTGIHSWGSLPEFNMLFIHKGGVCRKMSPQFIRFSGTHRITREAYKQAYWAPAKFLSLTFVLLYVSLFNSDNTPWKSATVIPILQMKPAQSMGQSRITPQECGRARLEPTRLHPTVIEAPVPLSVSPTRVGSSWRVGPMSSYLYHWAPSTVANSRH